MKNPKATKQPSAHVLSALPCSVGQALWLSACHSRPCLCPPISQALAELMKDNGAGPPESRGGGGTRAGERERGLGGHCRQRGNKGTRWRVTGLGLFS